MSSSHRTRAHAVELMKESIFGSVSRGREEETPEAKARRFQGLPLAERMRLLCELADLALAANPGLVDSKDAQPIEGRVRVLRAP